MDNHYFEEPEFPFFYRLKNCIGVFINLSVALCITFFLIRVFELLYIGSTKQFPKDFFQVAGIAFMYDILFLVKLLPAVFIPFLLIYFVSTNKKGFFWGYGFIGSALIILYLVLVKYYATALVPLGADLYGYSLEEIEQTIGAGTKLDIFTFIPFIIAMVIFWLFNLLFFRRKILNSNVATGVLILGGVLMYFNVSALPSAKGFKTDFAYNLSLNKEAFFLEKTYSYFTDDEPEIDIYASNYIDDPQTDSLAGTKHFTYINDQYPFLHKEETEDVLSNFFNIDSSQVPNIVFIQVEGLGRAFSGPNAYLGSFTPFLDQLATKSLYWENFLAAQGRTFASLPSILGSLPFAEHGYADFGALMPKHLTLLRILKKNGYRTRFYSGFDPTFDNEKIFLAHQGIDQIIGEKDYDKNYTVSPPNAGGFTWGYPDRELMRKSIQLESVNQAQPYITYMQTVTMHTPYTMPNQQQYLDLFEKYMNVANFDEAKKAESRQYKNIFSTILYTDEALKYFFAEYAKLPSFKNTIFIITGDHRLPEIPMSTKIDRYHVPLIIYSPMLKRTASFRSISSHLDITPSLLAFLNKSYKMKIPGMSAWVGSGLDTVQTLRNIHHYPLKQTTNDLINYISGLYFIDQDMLFFVGDNMDIEPLDDEGIKSSLNSEFNQYKARNEQFVKNRQLIPDSLYNKFK